MQNIVRFKAKNTGHFDWISYWVSTLCSVFDHCLLCFAQFKTESTRWP